jgi:tRNA A37 threonylcarbamoyladenosine synthetase subunit TsaC/SUA5/YrdC
MRELGSRVDLVLDGGVSAADRPSTVVDVTAEPPRIIRMGAVDVSAELI